MNDACTSNATLATHERVYLVFSCDPTCTNWLQETLSSKVNSHTSVLQVPHADPANLPVGLAEHGLRLTHGYRRRCEKGKDTILVYDRTQRPLPAIVAERFVGNLIGFPGYRRAGDYIYALEEHHLAKTISRPPHVIIRLSDPVLRLQAKQPVMSVFVDQAELALVRL